MPVKLALHEVKHFKSSHRLFNLLCFRQTKGFIFPVPHIRRLVLHPANQSEVKACPKAVLKEDGWAAAVKATLRDDGHSVTQQVSLVHVVGGHDNCASWKPQIKTSDGERRKDGWIFDVSHNHEYRWYFPVVWIRIICITQTVFEQQVPNRAPGVRVHPWGGLIQDHHLGSTNKSQSYRQLPLHSPWTSKQRLSVCFLCVCQNARDARDSKKTWEILGQFVSLVGKAQILQHVLHLFLSLSYWTAFQQRVEENVLCHRHAEEQAVGTNECHRFSKLRPKTSKDAKTWSFSLKFQVATSIFNIFHWVYVW